MSRKEPPATTDRGAVRLLYLICGMIFVTLGFAGIFLPVLPTTPFMIAAAACFAKSSRPLEIWLVSHKKFGPIITNWRERGTIPVSAKKAAVCGCAVGFLLFLYINRLGPLLIAPVAALMVCGISYVLTRPSA